MKTERRLCQAVVPDHLKDGPSRMTHFPTRKEQEEKKESTVKEKLTAPHDVCTRNRPSCTRHFKNIIDNCYFYLGHRSLSFTVTTTFTSITDYRYFHLDHHLITISKLATGQRSVLRADDCPNALSPVYVCTFASILDIFFALMIRITRIPVVKCHDGQVLSTPRRN